MKKKERRLLLLSEKELKVYRIEQCTELELEKIKKFYEKLNISNLMTLKGFYLIFWKELKTLNLDKIHNFKQLCMKTKRYIKHLKRMENRQKLFSRGMIQSVNSRT